MSSLAISEPLSHIRTVLKLYLELLFRCNFRCRTCYHGADLDRPDTVTRDQAVGALAYFADRFACRKVCFLGGEPLLYPKLPDLLACARDLGYRTEICTNGYKRRHVLSACAPHLDLLRVSLDGGTASAHDAIRKTGSFQEAFATLHWANTHDLPTGATSTLTSENIETVPELALRLRDAGAQELTLHRVRIVGNAVTYAVTEVTWEQTQRLHDQLTTMDLGQLTVNTDILLPPRRPADPATIDKLQIAPDGRVYLSCQQVAGPGQHDVHYDFEAARLIHADTGSTCPNSLTPAGSVE